MRWISFFIPLALLGISAVLLGKGWSHWQASNELVSGTEFAEGTIVRMAPYLGGKLGKSSALVYFPVVRFTPNGGREVVFEHQQSRRADHFKPGDKVPVRYFPDDPRKAVIATFSSLWSIASIYLVSGGLLLLFGGWFLRRAIRGS
ncbi:MAG TPA: DUF3592 domain-containing protein [Chromatiaceae bacterium]|nr:DUF3592 domain-containing protein [Chromatiaceae bacterium]